MEKTYAVTPIGRICVEEERAYIALGGNYGRGLEALEGFSHVVVLWWFHQSDEPAYREVLEAQSPYRRGPKTLGTFGDPFAVPAEPDRDDGVSGACGRRGGRQALHRLHGRAGRKPGARYQALYAEHGSSGSAGGAGVVRALAAQPGGVGRI